jgi:hypothetical protein
MPEDTYQMCVYQTNASTLLRLNLPLQFIIAVPWTETLPPEWPAMKSGTEALGNLERIELDGKAVPAAGVGLTVKYGSVLALRGWSADIAQDESLPERLLALRRTGDAIVRYVPVERWARPDVAQALGNPKLQETGFKVRCTIGPSVPAGVYRLEIIQRGSGAEFKVPLSLEVLP